MNLAQTLASALWVLAAVALWHRLPYGVSNRDEAFYSAMPYSFLLGNRPYIDELAMWQNAGLLLLPFYRVYVALVGSADGIILFNRQLYFAYICVCSWLTYRFVSRLAHKPFAILAATLVIPFSYFSLLSLSYNTCGAFGFFCGIMTTATAFLGPRPGKQLFGASLWFLSAVLAYPGYAPALFFYGVFSVCWLFRHYEREGLRDGLRGLAAALAAFFAVFVPLSLWLGKRGMVRLIAFAKGMGYVSGGLVEKFNLKLSPAWSWRSGLLAFACSFIVLPLACWLLQRAAWAVLLLLFVAAWYLGSLSNTLVFPGDALVFPGDALSSLTLPLLTPVCVALNREWRHKWLVLSLVWAPSLMSMVCVTYSSSNGFVASSLGSLGTTVAAVVSFHALLAKLAKRNAAARQPWFESIAACFVGLLIAQRLQTIYTSCYDEVLPLSAHDTRVQAGPFRGALATPHEAARLESLDRDLKSVEKLGQSITVFDDFPTAYLSTRLKPRTFSQWIVWGQMLPAYARTITQEVFGSEDKLPDLLLEISVKKAAIGFWDPFFRGKFLPIISRPEFDYVIMKRNTAP